MELVLTTDNDLRLGMDVVEGGYVYFSTPDTFVKWESLTSEEQAKWLEAQSIVTEAIDKAVAIVQSSVPTALVHTS